MTKISFNSKTVIQTICLQILPAALLMLFAYTGVSKLLEHELFFHQLVKITGLKNFVGLISYFVPVAEIIVAILLAFKSTRISGLILTTCFMAAFTVYVLAILSGDHIPCSCGGVISRLTWKQHLYLNLAFLIFSLTALTYYKSLHVDKEVSRKPLKE